METRAFQCGRFCFLKAEELHCEENWAVLKWLLTSSWVHRSNCIPLKSYVEFLTLVT